jgi:hypothetical protein
MVCGAYLYLYSVFKPDKKTIGEWADVADALDFPVTLKIPRIPDKINLFTPGSG